MKNYFTLPGILHKDLFLNVVEQITGLNPKHDIKNQSLTRVDARAVYFYLQRKYTRQSFREIGVPFKKDHTTVLHSINKADHYRKQLFVKADKLYTKIINT